ncbi:hypothetical protein [Shewanella sp.]|uniref:hypothetical protein n=1 Tax=Shewanella sp. TaxID=50422 RepID=UPI003A96B390
MSVVLPQGWASVSVPASSTMRAYQKTYADGLDVVLSIEHSDNVYQLWSSVEHRCSGPVKNMDSAHTQLDTAINAAVDEMVAWDKA